MGSCFACCRRRRIPQQNGLIGEVIDMQHRLKSQESLKRDKKLQKLVAYSGAHPEEISVIGTYLLQHMNRDLENENFSRVEVGVNIMDLLMDSCRHAASWSQLVENCLEMVKRLLMSGEMRLETVGIDLFLRHSAVHRDATNMIQVFNFLLPKFMGYMARCNPDPIRLGGFSGIKAICFNLLVALPSHNGHWAADLLAKILDSLMAELMEDIFLKEELVEEQANNPDPALIDAQTDFSGLFVEFLRELVLRCPAKDLSFVFRPIFKYFTMENRWNAPNDFANVFFLSSMAGVGEGRMEKFLQSLIKHMIGVQRSASTNDLLGMARLLAYFAPLATRRMRDEKQSGQRENFMAILELLQMSMELKNQRKDRELVGEYQDKLLEAIGKCSSGLPESLRLQAVLASGSPLPILIAEKPFFNAPPVQNY